jgi:hypothetical protein
VCYQGCTGQGGAAGRRATIQTVILLAWLVKNAAACDLEQLLLCCHHIAVAHSFRSHVIVGLLSWCRGARGVSLQCCIGQGVAAGRGTLELYCDAVLVEGVTEVVPSY